jgi:hypothetical protein
MEFSTARICHRRRAASQVVVEPILQDRRAVAVDLFVCFGVRKGKAVGRNEDDWTMASMCCVYRQITLTFDVVIYSPEWSPRRNDRGR